MNRQAQYFDANANPYSTSQMPVQQLSMQENTAIMPGNFSYISSQQNSDAPQVPNPNPNPGMGHLYPDTRQGRNPVLDSKTEYEKEREIALQSHEQDMEIGYEDKPQPLTFEALENKFQDEIRKLILEQTRAENAENYRHREKFMEINNKYQEKLSALRAQQASRRVEFLRKESEERLGKYQQSSMIRTSSTNLNSYVGPTSTEVHRAYPSGHVNQFDSYGEQPRRSRRTVGRVPYPQVRVYNNTGAHFE